MTFNDFSFLVEHWYYPAIVVLSIGQLIYFNLNRGSTEKLIASTVCSIGLFLIFYFALARMSRAKAAPARAR